MRRAVDDRGGTGRAFRERFLRAGRSVIDRLPPRIRRALPYFRCSRGAATREDDLVSARRKTPHDVTSEKTRSAGDDDLH